MARASNNNEARALVAADKIIGQRIRERRTQIGMTQDALAEALGVTFQQVQKYEQGSTRVVASRLYEMAVALECSPLDLLPPDAPGASDEASRLLASSPNALAAARAFAKLKDPEQERAVLNMLKAFAAKTTTAKKRK